MTSSLVVPVIDVQNENFKELWPAMILAIKSSSFVALDTVSAGVCVSMYLGCTDSGWPRSLLFINNGNNLLLLLHIFRITLRLMLFAPLYLPHTFLIPCSIH